MESQLKKLMTDWDYDKAVALARPIAEDWKKRTIEMARILYIANEQLNKKGKRTDLALKDSTKCNVALGSANKTPTWEDFCIEIGLPIRTAYDWLACYDPDKDLLLTHSEYKEARQLELTTLYEDVYAKRKKDESSVSSGTASRRSGARRSSRSGSQRRSRRYRGRRLRTSSRTAIRR